MPISPHRNSYVWIAVGLITLLVPKLHGFQPLPTIKWKRQANLSTVASRLNHVLVLHPDRVGARRSSRLYNKLWDRMQIEEDTEPHWYLINCVAGLEMDLLAQCRERCRDIPGSVKFAVPTETKTRSHGANRMVTETKVKYQGYVFAKLRLCPEVYGAIQSLDLCRSWMGTVNRKGYQKLPPSPVALNEVEVENFGLEELDFEEQKVQLPLADSGKEIIVDEAGVDNKNEIDEEALKAFMGIKVEDMVKVTKRCKFYNEDGIVRRLKDGKIFVRFYTYGTLFEEWMEPGDVRKLNDVEVLKGLSGPTQPITQLDFDGPRDSFGAPTKGRHAAGSFGGESNIRGARGPRNRRQDRVERGQTNGIQFGGLNEDGDREQENWDWYKENQGGNDASVEDDEWSCRLVTALNNAQRDGGSPWERPPSKRKQHRERSVAQQNRKRDDWSAFVTPASAPADDDFFSSLMADLSNDLNTGDADSKTGSSQSSTSSGAAAEEDAFFASLMVDVSSAEGKNAKPENEASSSLHVDDFFASFDAKSTEGKQESVDDQLKKGSLFDEDALFDSFNMVESKDKEEADDLLRTSKSTAEGVDDGGDFFASMGNELGTSDPKLTENTDNDFFASLERDLGSELGTGSEPESHGADDGDVFFASLGETLCSELHNTSVETHSEAQESGKPQKPSGPGGRPEASKQLADLSKLTVPKLKEMLRERGLKVGGKKIELIERLRACMFETPTQFK